MIDWLNPTTTLFASFAGAWAAFKLQSADKARDIRRANITATNRALLTMMQQANTLKLYQTDHIEPYREHSGRHFAIRPTLPYELEALRFDFGSLSFFDSPKEQQLLFDLSIEERRFIEALRAVNARSDLMISEVEPKLSSAGFLDGGSYGSGGFREALGQPLYNKFERLTDDMIYHVDKTNDSIIEMKDKFLSAANARYPGTKFVNFEFPITRAS